MRNILLLTRVQFQSFIGRLFKNKKNRSAHFGIGMLFILSGVFLFIFTSNGISTMKACLDYEAKGIEGAHELAIFTTCSISIILFLFVTLFRSISPNRSSDTDLLLSLPIKRIEIIASRNAFNYLFDLSCLLLAVFPSFVVYVYFVPTANGWLIVRALIYIILLAFLSNGIGGILSNFFSAIAKKMKHYSLFQSIISFFLIGIYIVTNFMTQYYIEKSMNSATSMVSFKESISILKYFMNYFIDGDLLFILIFGAICLSLYFVAVLISAKRLGNISLTNKIKGSKIYYKKQPILRTLVKKELKQYFNSAIYFINTGFTGVVYLGMAVAVMVLGTQNGLRFLNVIPNVEPIYLVLLVFTLLLGSFIITGSSISLEKNYLWLLKANPISEMTIFTSKILTNLVLTGFVALVSFPFMLSFLEITNFWAFLVIPFVASSVTSTLGLIINLKIPKLKWEREEEVVKQSLAGGLSLLLPIPLLAIPFVIQFTIGNKYLTFTPFALCYLLLLFLVEIIMLIWLKTKGVKTFKKIN